MILCGVYTKTKTEIFVAIWHYLHGLLIYHIIYNLFPYKLLILTLELMLSTFLIEHSISMRDCFLPLQN